MKIGIVGARLAGAYAGLLLSRMGHEVLLLDHTAGKEKPCAGGVTGKALRRISWLQKRALPHTEITALRMSTIDGRSGSFPLAHPIYVFSRSTLDSALLEDAQQAGARFIPERALRFSRQNDKTWSICSASGAHEVQFLLGADGATSSVRAAVAAKYAATDLGLALGLYLPGVHHPDTIIVKYQEIGFRGYIWSFPRTDHCSVGISRWLPEADARDLRRRVLEFISSHYPDLGSGKRVYAARLPCLRSRSLMEQRVCGPHWALLGDAAGFVDAITGEGIYYALRSAELFAKSLDKSDPLSYEGAWRNEFGGDLLKAAEWQDRFYAGTFLWRAFTRRVIQTTHRSVTARRLTDALIAGNSTYLDLLHRIALNAPRIVAEALRDKLRSHRWSQA